MIEHVPFQYSKLGRLFKKFLHTKIGAFVGYHLGVAGFNRIEAQVTKFVKYYDGKPLKKGYFTRVIDGTGMLGVYTNRRSTFSFNSRTDIGASVTASRMAGSTLGTATSPAAPLYIALSTATLTPNKADTTLASETVVAGIARALATAGTYTAPSVLDGSASYVLTKAFTLTGSATTVVSAGIFDAASVGNLFVEANLSSSAVLATNDILTITWTINV